MARLLALFVAVLVGLFWLFQLAQLTATLSLSIKEGLGPAGFLATFLFQVSNILRVTTPAIGALATGGVLSSMLARMGQQATEQGTPASVKVINLVLAAAAGGTRISFRRPAYVSL